MNFSVVQIAVVLSAPLLLTLLVSWRCRRAARSAMIGASFLLGALFLVPIARCSNFVTVLWPDLIGHFYIDELLGNFFTTAIPEELGKGLAALIVLKFTRPAISPLTWLACGAAAHSGFAAIEGLSGSLGNEGVLKGADRTLGRDSFARILGNNRGVVSLARFIPTLWPLGKLVCRVPYSHLASRLDQCLPGRRSRSREFAGRRGSATRSKVRNAQQMKRSLFAKFSASGFRTEKCDN